MPGREGEKTVIVFVASIDAISHACIYKDAGLGDKLYDRIALGGTAAHHPRLQHSAR